MHARNSTDNIFFPPENKALSEPIFWGKIWNCPQLLVYWTCPESVKSIEDGRLQNKVKAPPPTPLSSPSLPPSTPHPLHDIYF